MTAADPTADGAGVAGGRTLDEPATEAFDDRRPPPEATEPRLVLGALDEALGGVRADLAIAALAALTGLAAFAAHLLPGVGFWDTGIFQAAPPTLGLTHPTGYPTFVLLGWLFTSLVPIGDPAFRMNLLSALIGAAALGGLYVLCRWVGAGRFVALAAALTFGLLQAFWRTAVRADPHVLHVAFATALLLLVLEWRRRGRPLRWLVATAFVFGLSVGNHLLTLMLAPALAVFVLIAEPRFLLAPRRVAAVGAAALAGAAVYLYVPIAAATDPPIHHDFAPTTWPLFWRYVTGGDFQGSMAFLTLDGPAHALDSLPDFVGSLVGGADPPIAVGLLVLAAVGLVGIARTDLPVAILLALAGGLTLYASLTYANGDIERYYFVPIAVLVVFAAVGAQLILWSTIPSLPPLAEAAPLALVVPAVLAIGNAGRVDNASAACYANAVLDEVRPNAIVMSWWSYTTPLWYERFVVGRRPDVEVFNGIDLVPAELDARIGEGRPIYLIQPDSTLGVIQARYATTPVDACGVTMEAVTGRLGAG